jgi:hypothetical protein
MKQVHAVDAQKFHERRLASLLQKERMLVSTLRANFQALSADARALVWPLRLALRGLARWNEDRWLSIRGTKTMHYQTRSAKSLGHYNVRNQRSAGLTQAQFVCLPSRIQRHHRSR